MNCRFCGTYIPDGYNTCELCGRRTDERPIGELLSEYQPETFAHGGDKPKDDPKKRKARKAVFFPIVLVILSIAGMAYLLTNFYSELYRIHISVFSGTFLVLMSSDGYRMLLVLVAFVVLFVMGLAGLITLVRRIYNRIAYRELVYG